MELELKKAKDLARVSCASCAGCGDCCRNMGDTIHLDPYDFWMLEGAFDRTALSMYHEFFDFHEEDGIFVPHLLMKEVEDHTECVFLMEDGLCQVHDRRPGMCRLFPMGRQYEAIGLSYFVIPDGCDMPGKSKVRISDYLGIPDLRKYESFLSDWHRFIGTMKSKARTLPEEERVDLAQKIVQTFFIGDYYTEEDFYSQYMKRQMEFYRMG